METHNILFEKYINGMMSKVDKENFEEILKLDSVLNDDFTIYKNLNSYLEHKISNESKNNEFEKNLNKISDDYFTTKNVNKSTFKLSYLAVAASVLIAFGLFVFDSTSKPVYGDYALHQEINFTVRGDDNELLFNAEKSFNNGNYSKADLLFTDIIKSKLHNNEVLLYAGISKVEINEFDEARSILEKLTNGNSAYKYEAQWYFALSYLKQNNIEALKIQLNKINKDSEYYLQAQKLLNNF